MPMTPLAPRQDLTMTSPAARPTGPTQRPLPLGTRAALLFAGVILLSLAFAPYGQFYLGYVGFGPFFLILSGVKKAWTAFAWGFAAGVLFFAANMWWLLFVSAAGTVALSVYLALYWG